MKRGLDEETGFDSSLRWALLHHEKLPRPPACGPHEYVGPHPLQALAAANNRPTTTMVTIAFVNLL